MLNKDFGWRRSWISIPIAIGAFAVGFAIAGWLVNQLALGIAKVIGLLLGIGS